MTNSKSKHTVAHFIETDIPGGAEQVLLDICSYLQLIPDYEPLVISFPHVWLEEQCAKRNIRFLSIPFKNDFKKTYKLPLFGLKLAIWLKKNNIDIVHSHLFGPVTGAALGCWLSNTPHIGTLHDIYMINEKKSRFRMIQIAASLKTRLVTVSKQMENFYQTHGWLPQGSLSTIYNGVHEPEKGNDIRPSLRIAENDLVVTCVGRLIPLKQVEKVVDAFIDLDKANSHLLIVGDGPEMDNVLKKSKHLSSIHVLGQREDISDILLSSDIFVQYSTTEGLSRSIIEATMAGLPCIVSDVGGNHEIVEQNVNGMLVSANDDNALYNALITLMEKDSFREELKNNCATLAKTKFDFKHNTQQYVNLYQSLTK